MAERAYTITDLDALRSVVENKWLWGRYSGRSRESNFVGWDSNGAAIMKYGACSRSYREGEKTKAVEKLVRTHMLAGHTAQCLLDSETQ